MFQKTGIDGFDKLFDGEGILEKNMYMIKGVPGSGKTTMGIEYLYNGAEKYNEPGIMISFEESPAQLYRDAERMGWDLKKLEDEKKLRIISTSPAAIIQNTFIGIDGFLTSLIREMGIKRVVVDSITHFKRISKDDIEFRENLYKFVNGLKMKGITALLIAEYDKDSETADYVVDGVIYLRNHKIEGNRNKRSIEVFKSRGQGHISGEHYFDIDKGIKVYPVLREWYMDKEGRQSIVSTGIEELDNIMDGGYIKGTFNILVGSAGVGKTVFATNFLNAGARCDEKVLYLSFEEIPSKYYNFMNNLNINLEEDVSNKFIYRYVNFNEINLEKLFYDINKIIKENNIERVVIDTINDMFFRVDKETKNGYMSHLKYIFEVNNVTALCIVEEDKITGDIEVADGGYAFIADSIIIMRYLEIESNIRRIMTVLKARGLEHSNKITEYTIKKGKGIAIKERLIGLSGLMSGNPVGELKKSIEEIFQPIVFLEGVTDMIETGNSEYGEELKNNIKDVLGSLKEKLKEHFNIREGEINGV